MTRRETMQTGEAALHAAKMVGASTIFSLIPTNGKFRFPRSDQISVKIGPSRYKDEQGRIFSTGRHVAVDAASITPSTANSERRQSKSPAPTSQTRPVGQNPGTRCDVTEPRPA